MGADQLLRGRQSLSEVSGPDTKGSSQHIVSRVQRSNPSMPLKRNINPRPAHIIHSISAGSDREVGFSLCPSSCNRKGTRFGEDRSKTDFLDSTFFQDLLDWLAPAEFSTSPSHVDLPSLTGPGETVTLRTALSREKWIFRKFSYRSKTSVAASFCQISSFSPSRNKKYKALYSLPCSPRLRRAEADPCEEKELEWYDESLVNSHPRDDSLKTWSDFHVFWYRVKTRFAASLSQISSFSPARNKSYKRLE